MLFEQGNSSTWLSGDQPNSCALGLKTLDQFSELPKLVGIGRDGAAGEIETVGVLVDLQQFCHVEAMEDLGQPICGVDVAVQNCRPDLSELGFIQPCLSSHFKVMLLNVGKPLLAVGYSMATFVNDDCCGVGDVVEQRGWLLPGKAHQPTHAFRCATVEKLFCGLIPEESLQSIRHQRAQLIGNKWSEPRWSQSKSIDCIK